MTPFLAIVVDALGVDDGLRWFEAALQAHEVTRRDAAVDVDVYFECAAQACSRLGAAYRARVQQLEQGRETRAAAAR